MASGQDIHLWTEVNPLNPTSVHTAAAVWVGPGCAEILGVVGTGCEYGRYISTGLLTE